MFYSLPGEIQEHILLFTNFESCINNENYRIAKKLFLPEIHTWFWAASNGNLEVIKWLHINEIKGYRDTVISFAARNGHLDIVKWLLDNVSKNCTYGITTLAIYYASCNGHFEVVKWLHSIGKICSTNAIDGAASSGHLNIVKFLHLNSSIGCTTFAIDLAAENGHLEVVEWLHINRTEGYTKHAVTYAKNPEIVKFLTQTCK